MPNQSTYLYWLIVGCETAFWVVLAFALTARYLLRRQRLGRALLLSLPAVDLLLLAFTALDLKAGTPATVAHGLATAYVGFTVAFGPVAVRWADQHFAHWFAAGPPPGGPPARGWPAIGNELVLWFRCIVAWLIALSLLSALIAFVGNEVVTEPLQLWFRIAFGSVFVWFILGPCWSLLFLRRQIE